MHTCVRAACAGESAAEGLPGAGRGPCGVPGPCLYHTVFLFLRLSVAGHGNDNILSTVFSHPALHLVYISIVNIYINKREKRFPREIRILSIALVIPCNTA